MNQAGAFACICLLLAMGAPLPRPIPAQPPMAPWEVKAWAQTPCDLCGRNLDPYNTQDGLWAQRDGSTVLAHGRCARKAGLK